VRRVNVDLILRILAFIDDAGINLNWFLYGDEPRDKQDMQSLDDHALIQEVFDRHLEEAVDRVASNFISRARDLRDELYAQARSRQESPPPAAPRKRIVPGFRTVGPEELHGGDWDHHYVPIINRIAAGGEGFDTAEADSGPPGWANEYVAYEDPPAQAVALRVVGESMQPRYSSGDLLIVDPARPAAPGDPAAVLYRQDGGPDVRAVVKLFRPARTRIRLASVNQAVADIIIYKAQLLHAYAIHDHLPKLLEVDT